MLIIQYCEHGSLDSFLRARTGFDALTLGSRLRIAQDTCGGMAYLASAGFVHRDLAARNVLVGSDYAAKIADFGLSRDLEDSDYYRSEAGMLPVRYVLSYYVRHQHLLKLRNLP